MGYQFEQRIRLLTKNYMFIKVFYIKDHMHRLLIILFIALISLQIITNIFIMKIK